MEPVLSTVKIPKKKKEEFRDDDDDGDDEMGEAPSFPVECYKCGGTKFEVDMTVNPAALFFHCLGCNSDIVGFPTEPESIKGYVDYQIKQLNQRSS